MKKLIIALCMTSMLALAAHAAEGEAKKEGDKPKKPELTTEQKAFVSEMKEKYDVNKDGKLDKEEKSKMTTEEQTKWKAIYPAKKKGEGKGEGKGKGEAKPE